MFNRELMMQNMFVFYYIQSEILDSATGSRRVLQECQNLLPLLISNLFYSNISSSSYPFLTPFPQ